MPSLLVSPQTLPSFSRIDASGVEPALLTTICTAAHRIVAQYLNYDPAVQTYTGEEGVVHMARTGRDVATTSFRLRAQPLLSSDPRDVFTSLTLQYAVGLPDLDVLATVGSTLPTVRVRQTSGRVWVAWLGLGTLAGMGFQFGAMSGGAQLTSGAVAYRASYAAGYRISDQDHTDFPTATPVPTDIQYACSLVIEQLLAQASRVGQNATAAMTGIIQSFTNLDYTEKFRPAQPPNQKQVNSLLAETLQGLWAAAILDNWKRTTAEKVILT